MARFSLSLSLMLTLLAWVPDTLAQQQVYPVEMSVEVDSDVSNSVSVEVVALDRDHIVYASCSGIVVPGETWGVNLDDKGMGVDDCDDELVWQSEWDLMRVTVDGVRYVYVPYVLAYYGEGQAGIEDFYHPNDFYPANVSPDVEWRVSTA